MHQPTNRACINVLSRVTHQIQPASLYIYNGANQRSQHFMVQLATQPIGRKVPLSPLPIPNEDNGDKISNPVGSKKKTETYFDNISSKGGGKSLYFQNHAVSIHNDSS